jgi:hypothetical protein
MSGPGLGLIWELQGNWEYLPLSVVPKTCLGPCAGHIDGFIVSFDGEDLLLMEP